MTGRQCDNVLPNRGMCGEALQPIRFASGMTFYRCLRCAAREAGKCWSCGQTRTNHPELGSFCRDCAKKAVLASNARGAATPEAKAKRKAYDRRRYLERKTERLCQP
jgi:hypothetical protein